jgi:hypothetical protein
LYRQIPQLAVVVARLRRMESSPRFSKIWRQCFLRRHEKLISDALLLCCFFLVSVATSKTTAVYVDDVTCISIDTFTRIKAALAASGKQLAKIVVLCRGGLAALPAELRAYWEPAMRLLGGHVGDHEAASTMFAAHIHEKLQLIRIVQSAPMSLQSKFACLRSLDSGLRWKVMATSPAITAPTVAVIDDAVSSAVFSSCIDGSIPTHKSKALITIPKALGGLG